MPASIRFRPSPGRYAWLAVLALASLPPAPALADPPALVERRVLNVNGAIVYELKMGTLPRVGATPARLVTLAVTGNSVPNTTRLVAAIGAHDTLFDVGAPSYAFSQIDVAAIFSLSMGCPRLGGLSYAYIRGSRPWLAHTMGGAFALSAIPLAGNDQYDSVDCRTAADGLSTYFVLTNRTLGRVEVLRNDANGWSPAGTAAPAATPFGGGLRAGMALRWAAGLDYPSVLYTDPAGATQHVEFHPTNGMPMSACKMFHGPAPTGFTRVHETTLEVWPLDMGYRYVAIGDFNKNGVNDIVQRGSDCATQAWAGTSGLGDTNYNWTAYASGYDRGTGRLHFLFGDARRLKPDGIYEPGWSYTPYEGRGGPFHACTIDDLDGAMRFLTLAAGANPLFVEFARFRPPPNLFSGGFQTGWVQDCRAGRWGGPQR